MFGGVVPEIASRAHVEKIYQIVEQAIKQARVDKNSIDAIAVANQPGLVVALMVGVTAAKTLAMMWEKPLMSSCGASTEPPQNQTASESSPEETPSH